MISWIESLSGWDGGLPTTLIGTGLTPDERRACPQALAAGALNLDLDMVRVEQAEGRPPVVAQPAGSGLFLSSTRRGPFTATAVAASRVGVDVEIVDPGGEVPWNVLHPDEAALLRQQDGDGRALAFARLWSLKEAYLKALGIGLFREPSGFAVGFVDAENASFDDLLASPGVLEAKTTWRTLEGIVAAISAVVLEPHPNAELS